MTKRTFEEIRNEAAKLDMAGREGLGQRVDQVLDSARINADDTVYIEKAASKQDWDRIAINTISDVLSAANDQEVADWFSGIGISF